MKISYRTHPILKIIETKHFHCLVNEDEMDFLHKKEVAITWRNNCELFKNIKIITTPFCNAIYKSINKLLNNPEIFNGRYMDNGTFIFKRDDGVVETYCYDFILEDSTFKSCIFFYFQDDALIAHLNTFNDTEYVSSTVLTDGLTIHERLNAQLNNLSDFYLFTKFAEIETKLIPANKKIKDINCKYVNDTKFNVNILDSRWFTNLIKSDGFNVRGHFRLQPKKKDGVWIKQLIWINEFEKSGYTSLAKVNSEINQ